MLVSQRGKSPVGSVERVRRIGLRRAHVGEIERGESNVTIQTLKIVAGRFWPRLLYCGKNILAY